MPLLACAQIPAQAQGSVTADPLTAEDIMARVAANQDRSEQERAHFVYVQHTRTVSRKGKTVRCEEITDYRVTPAVTRSEKKLLRLDGRLLVKGRYVQYDTLDAPKPAKPDSADAQKDSGGDAIVINAGDESIDRDLVENLRKNLTSAPSKDGLGAELFPLTSKAQAEDTFHLLGREPQNGRDTYHLTFAPKDRSEFGWKGDAWIDAASFQPVVIRTTLSRKIPLAVRTLLGTNVPGLGFTIIYAPQANDTWFPVSFGTEFHIDVFFFLRREITLAVINRDFERTHVSSTIVGADSNVPATSPGSQP